MSARENTDYVGKKSQVILGKKR